MREHPEHPALAAWQAPEPPADFADRVMNALPPVAGVPFHPRVMRGIAPRTAAMLALGSAVAAAALTALVLRAPPARVASPRIARPVESAPRAVPTEGYKPPAVTQPTVVVRIEPPDAAPAQQREVPAASSPVHPLPRPAGFDASEDAARLHVNCRPWCRVTIDGRSIGLTPLELGNLAAGRHDVTLENPSTHFRRRFALTLAANETRQLEIDAGASGAQVPAGVTDGRLSIAVSPWGNVSVDGHDYGSTPIGAITLPAGRHAVRITNPEQQYSRTFTVDLVAGETRRMRIAVTHEPDGVAPANVGTGRLGVSVVPWGNVTVDGRDLGMTPIGIITLPAGRHTVTITNPELNYHRTVTVDIVAGETRRIREDASRGG